MTSSTKIATIPQRIDASLVFKIYWDDTVYKCGLVPLNNDGTGMGVYYWQTSSPYMTQAGTTALYRTFMITRIDGENIGDVDLNRILYTAHEEENPIIDSVNEVRQEASAAVGNFATDYANLTFPAEVGTHCTHGGNYYVANTKIDSSEAWTAAHWTQVTAGAEISNLKSAFNDLVSLVPIVGRRYFHLVVGSCHVAGTSIYVPSESTKVVMLQEILTRPSGIQFCFDDTIYELAYVTLSAEGISTGYYAWVGSTSPWTEPTPSSTPSYCTILLRRKDGGVFTGDPDTVLWQEEVEQNQIIAQRQLAESNAAAYTDEQIRNKVREIPAGFVQYGFPDGFSWTDNPVKDRVYTDGKGRFFVDYNVMDHVSTEGLDVYMAADGNNANDGLTAETPKLTLAAAAGITNARRVHIAGGYYPREEITLSADIDLIGDPDNRAVFTGQNASTTWTATAVTGVYTTDHKNYGKVYDLTDTSSGTYRQYTEVQSVEAVQAAEGTYYDDGTTVTIHTYSNVELTLDKVCYAQGWSAFRILLNGHTALIAHLSFTCSGTYSGRGQLMLVGDDTSRGTFMLYHCNSSYSIRPAGDNISGGSAINPGNADGIIQHCAAYHAGNDGFSYGAGCKIVEIGCASAFNGTEDITSCNGSTAHGGSYIRINGAYHDTHGPVVHDVGATESVNLGLAAWHSTCEGKPNFCASGGAVKMWLDSCVGYSSDHGIDVGKDGEPAVNAVIYKRNCTSDVSDNEYGGHIYRY